MPIDPNIYSQIQQPNMLQTITSGLQAGNALSDMSYNRTLREREEAAYPQQQADIATQRAEAQRMARQKHIQELSYGLSQGLDPQHGVEKESLIFHTLAEAKRRGLDNNDVQQLLTPMNSGKDDASMSAYYLKMANPQEAMKAQFAINSRKQDSPIGKINPSDYTPDSLRAWQAGGMKDASLLVAVPKASLVTITESGRMAADMGLVEGTPEHAAFLRMQAQRKIEDDATKRTRDAELHALKLNGGDQPKKEDEWRFDAGSDQWVKPPTEANPEGERSESVGKQQAAKAMTYLINEFKGTKEKPGILYTATTGGPMGAYGKIGRVTNSQAAKRFDNLREQMSTQLRTLFRIPGEGTLSDREQAQYGLQLPQVDNETGVNESIIKDITEVMRIRSGAKISTITPPAEVDVRPIKFLGFE